MLKKQGWIWEVAFYQSEGVKINSSGVILAFSLYVITANVFELFYMAHLAITGHFLYHFNSSF